MRATADTAAITIERDAYREAFLKLAPWCDDCCDQLATVELSVDGYDATCDKSHRPIKCCDICVESVRRKRPERIVEDLEWAALARKER